MSEQQDSMKTRLVDQADVYGPCYRAANVTVRAFDGFIFLDTGEDDDDSPSITLALEDGKFSLSVRENDGAEAKTVWERSVWTVTPGEPT